MEIGFAMCGSFCTYSEVFPVMEEIAGVHNVIPIFSFASASIDSRFGTATEHLEKAREICGRSPLRTIEGVEPIGPKKLLDALVIAPCTGNTLAKLALGVTDTSVTMAAKAHLRNSRPLIIAVATNDALSANSKNIGILMNTRNVYFVPMKQDEPEGKPTSVIADFSLISKTVDLALSGKQIQPIYL